MKQDHSYKPRSAWNNLNTRTQRGEVTALAERYMDFLSSCKTERETTDYVCRRLREAGYGDAFAGARVARDLRGKAVFAVLRGKAPLKDGLDLIAAHVDTPRLDFKQRPLVEQVDVVQAKTHYYGGIRKYQWLARPLALHGVIIRENGEKIPVTIGEKPDEPVFCIADLLPHLAQKQSDQKLGEAFEAEKLNVIMGHSPKTRGRGKDDKSSKEDDGKTGDAVKTHLLDILHAKYGIREEDMITAELQAVPAGPARFVGLDRALVGGYGQDDRICVFAALEALLRTKPGTRAKALIFWDKEEIGSDGATSASSRFLEYCLESMLPETGPANRLSELFLNSRALSADVQGALDPDFQDLHEKQNAARLGYGPCFSKFTGSRGKYGASEADAEYFAFLRGLLNSRAIPWQAAELGKVDQGGGGTVALFLAAYGMQVIDFGPPVLSMHSPCELTSCADLWYTVEAYKAFLEA
ncbi:MAG: aminopeptidase [Desulfovibrio sp.]|jgi:aspartyl aminopeptidase|nr:aminopeptidase [Desulfovibrio sp.]